MNFLPSLLMQQKVEVLEPGQLSLFELADIANREHELCRTAAHSFAEHAKNAGLALIEAKARVEHGEWLPWLAANFVATDRHARRYMYVAANWTRVSDLDTHDLSLRGVLKELASAETRDRRERSRAAPELDDGFELREGDAREVLADVAESSVQLILTDPPYAEEADPLYEWLAAWSKRVLEPGGSLIVYTGQSRLERDLALFGRELRYWWLLSMLHTQAQRLAGKFVMVEFKPVLWFVKDYRRGRSLVNDVLRPIAPDAIEPRWAQGEGGIGFLIEHLTEPGERIVDPFAGTAQWGRIAASMGRRWLGADVAPEEARAAGVIEA